MPRGILVPLDGSQFGERALPLALHVARREKARLHIAHVLGAQVVPYSGADPIVGAVAQVDTRDDMQRYLTTMRMRIQGVCNMEVADALLTGSITSALDHYSQSNDVGMIVMSTHGRGGISRTWLGSVAEEMVKHAHLPVLLTRPDDDVRVDLREPVNIERILVPLQSTAFSEGVLRDAEQLAAALGAEMLLVEVVVPIGIHPLELTAPVAGIDRVDLQERTRHAHTYLEGVAGELRMRGRVVSTRVLTGSHVATTLINAAEEEDAGLIAMATHARRGIKRLLLGSVADKVLRGTTRAVILCRPD